MVSAEDAIAGYDGSSLPPQRRRNAIELNPALQFLLSILFSLFAVLVYHCN